MSDLQEELSNTKDELRACRDELDRTRRDKERLEKAISKNKVRQQIEAFAGGQAGVPLGPLPCCSMSRMRI